jgi:uncharacterized protein (DUF1800 family)
MVALAMPMLSAAAGQANGRRQSQAATAAPNAPPSRIAIEATTGQVELQWSSVEGARGYLVFRGVAGVWGAEPIARIQRRQFTDRNVTNGVVHAYKVAAANSVGAGPQSDPVSVTPLAPPTELKAEAGDQKVALAWRASTGATGYIVLRGLAGQRRMPIGEVASPSFVDTGLTNGTAYEYRVRAKATNSVSRGSNSVLATPTGAPTPAPTAAPTMSATGGNGYVDLSWTVVPNATGYKVFNVTGGTSVLVTTVTPATTLTFRHTPLPNGTAVSYRVAGTNSGGDGPSSNVASATPSAPTPAPTTAPTVSATGGDGYIDISWTAVPTATGYKVFNVTGATPALVTTVTTSTTLTFKHTPLPNGTAVSYRVAGTNAGGDGPLSNTATATPNVALSAPTNLSAVAGNAMITLAWTPVTGATSYRVYRGTTSNGQSATPLSPQPTTSAFVDSGLTNGTTYFYKVTAVASGTESARSDERSATPLAPTVDPTTLSAFRLLRQSTWGPRPATATQQGDVEHVLTVGVNAFIDEQVSAPMSTYPDTLYEQSVEHAQEHFMSLAVSGPDQLRQRVAFALHKIWVVSAVELNDPRAIVPYYRLMMQHAFGNYKDLMRAVTLNPAMGRYLNMANNRAQAVTSVVPNENYAREFLQLFTMGLVKLNPNGTPVLDANGVPEPSYTEADVKALAKIFTGWTYGDGNAGTIPGGLAGQNFLFPMEPVLGTRNFHDTTAKTLFSGDLQADFPAGVAAQPELDRALDVVFNHPNVGPFVARQLIQQLVTSNPSAAYIQDIATVFGAPGSANRGDLAAVVRAILTHPEAGVMTNTSGKLSEPVIYAVSMVRALNATVTDHPFLSDLTAQMGQRVFFPPSVFSYFSPGFRVQGTGPPTLVGPEFQPLTSVTSTERVNFAGRLLGNQFGADVTVDYTPFTSRAANAADLVDHINLVFMGGRMSAAQRAFVIDKTDDTPATLPLERARTALYLTITAAQAQVDN